MPETDSSTRPPGLGSDRSFGFVFAAVALLFGLRPIISKEPPSIPLLAIAGGLLLVTIAMPVALYPLHYIWFRLGLLLHRATNPIIMGILFYGVLAPVGIVMRVGRRDRFGLAIRQDVDSYWKSRGPIDGPAQSMKRQF